ncbi:hypothetical protein DFQ12_5152 [Sphingobacterium detergens]|uniref:Uncharacterized protein n=1 Tax=Sphingobacterium detergens TaxID=1145106 RepID=A0A420AFR8_SPHD1|nr:hypothetical protein DFQ12_5152 [Sphingobacterium detergens]
MQKKDNILLFSDDILYNYHSYILCNSKSIISIIGCKTIHKTKIVRVDKVPSTPLKSLQVRASANNVRVRSAHASGLRQHWFDIWSVRRRSFIDNRVNNSRRTVEPVPSLSQRYPEAMSMSSRRIPEQLPNSKQSRKDQHHIQAKDYQQMHRKIPLKRQLFV